MTHFLRLDLTSGGETSVCYFMVAEWVFIVGHLHPSTFFPPPKVLNFIVLVGDFLILMRVFLVAILCIHLNLAAIGYDHLLQFINSGCCMHIVTRFVTHLWISSTMHRMALSALCFREGWRQDFLSFFVGCNRSSLQDAGFKVILFIYLLIYLSTSHISVCYLCAILLIDIYIYMFVHNGLFFLPPIMLDSYKICCWLTTTQLLCAHSVSHSKVKASNIQQSGLAGFRVLSGPLELPVIYTETNQLLLYFCL